MRQYTDYPRESRMLTAVSDAFTDTAESVTVTRPANIGGQSQVQQLLCVPQPHLPFSASNLQLEGAVNVAESTPHGFLFLSGSDVRPGDQISYAGNLYEVGTAIPQRLRGVTMILMATAFLYHSGS